MPFSQSSQISAIVQTIEKLQPKSLLDVGIGMGQYGYLSRINLEHINLFSIENNVAHLKDKSEWQIKIDGIEGFSEYLTPVHHYVYNDLFIGNALEILPKIQAQSYELVIAIDILEHFEVEEALFFIKELKRASKKYVLISTPKTFIEQEVEANPLENHRSLWSLESLQELGFTEVIENNDSWIVVYNHP